MSASTTKPVKARPIQLVPQMTTGEAFRVTLQECLAQIAGNLPAVRARQSEGVHQLRVGFRRLNAALMSFGDPFRVKRLKIMRRQAKALASAFGPLRDLDVFLSECLPPVMQAAPENESLTVLKARAEGARNAAWDTALTMLASGRVQNFLDDAAATSESKRWTKIGTSPIAVTAGATLEGSLARALKRARPLDRAEDQDFHRLRLASKRLRYATEFFEGLYDAAITSAYLEKLKSLQDCLGEMNDVVAARAMLQRLAAEADENQQAPFAEASADIITWHAARGPARTAKALRKWEKLRGEQPFWH